MNIRNFDLNLLVVFDALIRECNVTRAADEVFLSQSAMSHALNRLRSLLDDPILVRTDGGMRPTPRALELLPDVQKALQLINRAIQPQQQFEPQQSQRKFVIAGTDYFEAVVMPQLMSHFQTIAPGLQLEIDYVGSDISEAQLERGAIDLVVGVEASQVVPSRLVVSPWISESLVCIASAANTAVGKRIALAQYIDSTHVYFSDLVGGHGDHVDEWLAEQGLKRDIISVNLSYWSAARTVAMTDYIMTMPKQLALIFAQMMPLKVVQPPKSFPTMALTLVHHPLYEKDPAISWLRQQVQQVVIDF